MTATPPARPSHAFVDESFRAPDYYVCAALLHAGDVNDVRKLARSLCKPGQRRWHFTSERDSRRRQILDAILATPSLRALITAGKGDGASTRADCMHRLGIALLDTGTTRLIIESREGRDHQDRQALYRATGGNPQLHYEHAPAASDPALWLADAIAWTFSAGGQWRQRLEPILINVDHVH